MTENDTLNDANDVYKVMTGPSDLAAYLIEKSSCTCLKDSILNALLCVHMWSIETHDLLSALGKKLLDADSCLKTKIIDLLRHWTSNYDYIFDEDCCSKFEHFGESMNIPVLKLALREIANGLRLAISTNRLTTHTEEIRSRRQSMSILNSDANEIATCLTYLDLKMFSGLPFTELRDYARTGSLLTCPNLNRFVQLSNGLCKWTQCMVLKELEPFERCNIICKFVDIAENLKRQNNYNSLMAVVGGVCNTTVLRLSNTLAQMRSNDKKKLQYLQHVLSPSGNYRNYRQCFNDSDCPKIPIAGIILKDLTLYEVAMPSVHNELDVRKLLQIFAVIEPIIALRSEKTALAVDSSLVDILMVSFNLSCDDNDLYELSLKREPRNEMKSSERFRLDDCVYSDIMERSLIGYPLGQHDFKENLEKMINAVFENYDVDKDGFISETEFQDIKANFPFIESFSYIDKNNDGKISKDEIRKYFSIRTNYFVLRWEFRHHFQSVLKFRPKTCDHCHGFLWGLSRQGQMCINCGLIVHRECAETVVKECQQRKL